MYCITRRWMVKRRLFLSHLTLVIMVAGICHIFPTRLSMINTRGQWVLHQKIITMTDVTVNASSDLKLFWGAVSVGKRCPQILPSNFHFPQQLSQAGKKDIIKMRKVPQKDCVQYSDGWKGGSKQQHICITQQRGSNLPGIWPRGII